MLPDTAEAPTPPQSHAAPQAKLGSNAQCSVRQQEKDQSAREGAAQHHPWSQAACCSAPEASSGTALMNTSSTTLCLPMLCQLHAALSACVLGWPGGWREGKPLGFCLEAQL